MPSVSFMVLAMIVLSSSTQHPTRWPSLLGGAGFSAVVIFYLALLLPGQNIHGGTLTGYTLWFGLLAPPLCFLAGLAVAVIRRRLGNNLGTWLNVGGLVLYVLWVTGVLHTLLGLA